MHYRPEIDGLRAVAVIPVVLFHAGSNVFAGGFVGVDVFFVISGYLITTILARSMLDGSFSLLTFYERRARRILPALFFIMAVTIPFALLWMRPNQFEDFAQSIVAVVFSPPTFCSGSKTDISISSPRRSRSCTPGLWRLKNNTTSSSP